MTKGVCIGQKALYCLAHFFIFKEQISVVQHVVIIKKVGSNKILNSVPKRTSGYDKSLLLNTVSAQKSPGIFTFAIRDKTKENQSF